MNEAGVEPKKTIQEFLLQYFNTKSNDISQKLDNIINNNIKKFNKDDWQYYILKYENIIKNLYWPFTDVNRKHLILALPRNCKVKAVRMSTMTLRGYHNVALYLEVIKHLKDKADPGSSMVSGEDDGWIYLNCGVYIYLDDNLKIQYALLDGVDESTVKKIDNNFRAKNVSSKDYVEQLEMYGQMMCKEFNI